MGERVVETAREHAAIGVTTVISRHRPEWIGGLEWQPTLDGATGPVDVVIDFTLPGGPQVAAEWCRANLAALVSGTTGLTEPDTDALRAASELVPVLWAPNLSKGLNLCLRTVVEMASQLPAETPVEITDIHHVHKQDSPSGTALFMAQAIAGARGQDLDAVLRVRDATTAGRGPEGSITCVSLREGEAIGTHQVRFRVPGEEILVRHSASDRDVYAHGALEAAAWLVGQDAGLYSVADWLT
ncbi:MAG: 4-hydroxy-tetrahydrodipicolinate reductase [Xanthomonadales bacterium]|nr:4-hydroxy-tetrahydrodipicolinate reductase [Xanthomonadales bacterium]NIN59174.1 4-hydroxy-tetrahydrodipicolinate reductase [Xanthomonadales bacterium]NIN74505.1 4-hydroxy-tetrahydrodipicolinate reductase [Xanthomonadales bacterium]NIO13291.1 4-hydroxy-tetrahydrodipicolinate reductase [Xanthomonadales bacterium]NIP11567.1 4-hydroxy-tetrahydrodipicolinate reductase [Xanthomonadales bacterium]